MKIHEEIGIPATLEQCAEECTELGHACLKLARVLRAENPTPVTREEALKAVNEEMADILVCMNAIVEAGLLSYEAVDSVYVSKEKRWPERIIKNKEEKGE